jgi:hypothetical protein
VTIPLPRLDLTSTERMAVDEFDVVVVVVVVVVDDRELVGVTDVVVVVVGGVEVELGELVLLVVFVAV